MSVPFYLTVDTEEDDWGQYSCRNPSVRNIAELPEFTRICHKHGAVATFLVNWPVATSGIGRAVLRELQDDGAEIGAHCHPWNTPPLSETPSPAHSYLCNLPEQLVRSKLLNVHRVLTEAFGHEPVSFRAGRWGGGAAVSRVLLELGYLVDSSVSPFQDWTSDFGPDYSTVTCRPYTIPVEQPWGSSAGAGLLEVPPTIGFTQRDQEGAARAHEWIRRHVAEGTHVRGVLDRLRLLNMRWLSPDLTPVTEMKRLVRMLIESGAPYLHLTFHSPTLLPGCTPFVRTAADRARFLDALDQVLDFAAECDVTFSRLSDSVKQLHGAGIEPAGLPV